MRGVQRKQARLLDLHAGFRDPLPRHALFGDGLAERGARHRALTERFKRPLREPDRAHAVMDPAGSETPLRDLKAAAFAEQDIRSRHTHVLERHFTVAVGRIVIPEHMQRTQHLHACGVGRHQDHRLAPVLLGVVGVGLPHEDEDLAALVGRARCPPLAAIDDVMIAVAFDRGADVGRV